MKKKLLVGMLSLGLLAVPTIINAQGTATIKFEGVNNTNVGSEIRVNMIIDDVKDTIDGVEAFGGYIKYDDSILELVSTEEADNKYPVFINKDINKIAGLDFTLENGIKDKTNVYTMVFKTKNAGNTVITLANPEVVDRLSDVDYKVEGLNVSVKDQVEIVKPITTVTTTTTTTKKAEVKTEVVAKETTQIQTTEPTTAVVEEEVSNTDVTESTDNNIIVKIIKSIISFFKNINM